jgi:hypothetical protein
MMVIPIYSLSGVVDQIEIDDDMISVDARVIRGTKSFYKGAGGHYKGHFLEPGETTEHRIVHHSDVFYIGDKILEPSWIDKFGIFQTRYQPQFDDFVNSCGSREMSLIENSQFFERSSVVVKKATNYDLVNRQYYFELDYKCGRVKYLSKPSPYHLKSLLIYMVQNDWNFIWDKNTIEDISYKGLVTDVADVFYSSELKSKLGTVYSVLYSLHNSSPEAYVNLLKVFNLKHKTGRDFVLNSIKILKKIGVDVSELNNSMGETEIYTHALLNYLTPGRNCGDCVLPEIGEQIRNQYIDNVKIAIKGKFNDY